MSGRHIIAIVVVLFVLLIGWFSWGSSGERPIDPALIERFENEQKPILDRLANAKTDTDRSKVWSDLRTSMESYSEDERRQVGQLMRADGERREDEKITSFFKLTPAQQLAALDKEIDESERRRQRWAADRAKNSNDKDKNRTGSSNNSGNSSTSSNRSNGGRGGPGGGPGGGPPGGSRGNFGSSQSKQRYFQKYLNNSTPESRALRASYSSRMDERRSQRGLSPSGNGPNG